MEHKPQSDIAVRCVAREPTGTHRFGQDLGRSEKCKGGLPTVVRNVGGVDRFFEFS
jgi:hypothetical protein